MIFHNVELLFGQLLAHIALDGTDALVYGDGHQHARKRA